MDKQQQIKQLEQDWATNPRWKGLKRGYGAADVVRLRGSLKIEHTLARRGAEKLWSLCNERPFVNSLGALTNEVLKPRDPTHPAIRTAAARSDYSAAFTAIAALQPAVATFFDDVLVMAEDARVRAARLGLVAALRDLILEIADLSEIVADV